MHELEAGLQTSASSAPEGGHLPGLAVARQLAGAGLLPGIADFSLTKVRRADGSSQLELVGEPAGSDPPWHPSRGACEPGVEQRDRLLLQHARWQRACAVGRPHHDSVVDHAKAWLAARGTEVAIAASGISTGERRSDLHPTTVLIVAALGRDARPGLDRLVAHHVFDLDTDLGRVADRHAAATLAAAGWVALGAVGAIEDTADAVLRHCGVKLELILEALEWQSEVGFDGAEGLSGTATWRDFAITVDASQGMVWRIEGGVLTLKKTRVPATLTSALAGGPLKRLVEIGAMPADITIDSFGDADGDDLKVTLRPGRQLITIG